MGERLGELRGGGEAIGGELLQCAGHGCFDVRRDRLPLQREGARIFGHDACHDGLRRGAGEGRLAAQQFVEDAAQRIDVGARIKGALAHRLLGAHVVRRAE